MDVIAWTLLLLASSVTSQGPCGTREGMVVQGGSANDDGSRTAGDGTRFPPGCSWKSAGGVIMGCAGAVKPCLWKCCAEGHVFDDEEDVCLPSQSDPPLPPDFLHPPRGTLDPARFEVLHALTCSHKSYVVEAEGDNFTVGENGSLSVVFPGEDGGVEEVPPGEFCQEAVESQGAPTAVRYLACYNPEDEDPPAEKPGVKFLINAAGMIISLPFLLATIVVYASIPELRNLHGKCLMSHVASLFVGFLSLVTIQLGQWPPNTLPKDVCIAAALIGYFSLLAGFFWLNAMGFDIWWTFSGYSTKIGRMDFRANKKFACYSLYSWGSAVVFLCVCTAMQFSPGLPDYVLRPRFGEKTCWFNEDPPTQWAYFNGPIGVLILCNIVFFVLTALRILKVKRETAVLRQDSACQGNSQQENNEIRFKLYLKLFIVMGVSWSMEIISSAVGGPDYIWWVTDLANVLVGIPIFVIFVWKSRTRKLFMAQVTVTFGSSRSGGTSSYDLT